MAGKLHDKLFISQDVLESWVDSGKVAFEDDILQILANGRSYHLVPALRFLSVLDGTDEHGITGKIRTKDFVLELNGEHVADSCLIGETAYEVQEGFIGEIRLTAEEEGTRTGPHAVSPGAAPAARVAPPPPPPPPRPVSTPTPITAPTTVLFGEALGASTSGRSASSAPEDDGADLLTKFLLENMDK